jgi:hypothetical protein
MRMRSPRIAAGERRRRIDAHDADLLPRRPVVRDQRVDDRRLAGARVPGDTDHVRAPGVRIQRLQRRERLGPAVVDVAHQPRRGADVACEDLVDRHRVMLTAS